MLSILIAEDNMLNQKIMQLMLRKLGHNVDVAANGLEALRALESRHYDVILMDIDMPEMDGLEATRTIRRLWPDNGPYIIAITACVLNGTRKVCLDAGMDDYISKPVRIEDLRSVLELCAYPSTTTA